jgi:hypothetical protein
VDRAPGGWSRVLSGVRAVLVTDLFSDRSPPCEDHGSRSRLGASEAGVAGPTLDSITNSAVLGRRLVGGGLLEHALKLRHLLTNESARVRKLLLARGR